jgi:toxin ParE1/3/4
MAEGMSRPRFTTEAWLDLEEIVRYIGTRNPSAAARLTDGVEETCWRLARQPGLGQSRPDLLPGIRFIPLGSYLIFYRECDEGIQVLRVLHGARDYGPADFSD